MKYSFLVAAVAFAFGILPAQARIDCHHDPVCQGNRDGTSATEARKRDQAMTACLRSVGYTQEDWHAYRVPAGPAVKVRSCFSRHGLPTQ